MSDMVVVDIKTPQNEILEDSQLPFDYSVQMIIDELVDTLELPRLDESARPINYMLRSAQQGRSLASQETVQAAQIMNGDTLELQTLNATAQQIPIDGMPMGMPPIPPGGGNNYAPGGNNQYSGGNEQYSGGNEQYSGNNQYSGGNDYDLPQTVAMPNTSEINVVLSVMDLNRHETVSLSVTRPVGDLIRQIVGNYDLPARDNLNQMIKYKLQSKALGRFLDERMTLLEAQIPPLDRLTLHRDEIAG